MGLADAFGGSAKAGDNKPVDPFAMLGAPAAAPVPAAAPAPAAVPAPSVPRPPAAPARSTSPAPAPAPAPAAVKPAPTLTPVTDQAAARSAPPRKRNRPAAEVRAELEEIAESTSQVQVYLAPWAIRTIRAIARAEGLTNSEIAYDAIDAAGDELNDLVRARLVDQRPSGSAFPGRSSRRRPRNGGGAARALWSLQATPKEREVLERLQRNTGADSLSQLVSAAIEWHLRDHPLR